MKESPLGSTPILARISSDPRSASARANTNGFEIDWIVNGWGQHARVVGSVPPKKQVEFLSDDVAVHGAKR